MLKPLKTELYLDSQQTIINDLRDTFNCKFSNESTNVLKINTSTYSITRTTNHITQRLQDACKRLQSIQTSVNKSKCSLNKSQENVKKKLSYMKTQNSKCQNCGAIRKQNKQLQQFDKNSKQQYELVQIISKLNAELTSKRVKIEEIEQKIQKVQNKMLASQQKYLKLQKQLRIQINHLNDLLSQKNENENIFFNQKIQLQRIIDQHKIKLCQAEQKIKILQQESKNWHKKQQFLKKVTKKYIQSQNNIQLGVRSNNKKQKQANGCKQIIYSLRKVLQLNVGQNKEQNKQNNCQNVNRLAYNEYSSRNSEAQPNTFRSYQAKTQRQVRVQTNSNIKFMREQQQNQTQVKQQFYRMLLIQASTIQKLSS